jgi:hypothetical protein
MSFFLYSFLGGVGVRFYWHNGRDESAEKKKKPKERKKDG